MRSVTFYTRIGGGGFTLLLVGTSFLVLLVIISIRMSTRKEEVEILDLIGATTGFIRSPIIIEALIYAAVGVFVGWAFALILILYATPSVISYFGEIPVIPKDTITLMSLFGAILAVELFVGIFLALFGSLFAVSRARRR